jgi:hypothetical protein
MDWLNDSIMRRRGVAQGRTPDTHALTEALQGKYHYTIGPYSDPVLKIRPGDRVVVETRDAFEGKVKTAQDLPSRVLRMPFVNPQNGPIRVEGASKGDVDEDGVYWGQRITRPYRPHIGTLSCSPEISRRRSRLKSQGARR